MLIAVPIYLIPFFFVYNPIFILQGSFSIYEFIWIYLTGIAGIYALGSGLQGFMLMKARLNIVERVILAVTAIVLIAPLKWESLIALITLALMQVWVFFKGRRRAAHF